MPAGSAGISPAAAEPPDPTMNPADPPASSTSSETSVRERLAKVRAEMAAMGATPEYCATFYMQQAGVCEKFQCGGCVKHSAGQMLLPPGVVCRDEVGAHIARIKGVKATVDQDITAAKNRYEAMLAEEKASDHLVEVSNHTKASIPPPCLFPAESGSLTHTHIAWTEQSQEEAARAGERAGPRAGEAALAGGGALPRAHWLCECAPGGQGPVVF